EADGRPAGAPDGERVVVAVPERHPAAVARGEHVECLRHHRALDAASGHRTDDVAVLAHRHRRTGLARPGTLDVDDAGERDPLAFGPPPVQIVEQILHALTSTTITAISTRADASP